jgi:hypothetical protein
LQEFLQALSKAVEIMKPAGGKFSGESHRGPVS